MRIFVSKNTFRGDFIAALLSNSTGPPLVQFGRADQMYDQISLDDARRLARAILAIPRPVDAPPEDAS